MTTPREVVNAIHCKIATMQIEGNNWAETLDAEIMSALNKAKADGVREAAEYARGIGAVAYGGKSWPNVLESKADKIERGEA